MTLGSYIALQYHDGVLCVAAKIIRLFISYKYDPIQVFFGIIFSMLFEWIFLHPDVNSYLFVHFVNVNFQ
ncbi:hypothetical protein ACJX0J_017427, partial [Zea mays]